MNEYLHCGIPGDRKGKESYFKKCYLKTSQILEQIWILKYRKLKGPQERSVQRRICRDAL